MVLCFFFSDTATPGIYTLSLHDALPISDSEYKAGVRAFPELLPEQPDDEGAELSRRARSWLEDEWPGETFMAIGMRDPVLTPKTMHYLRKNIRNCPDPYEVAEGGQIGRAHV